jgi:hypothetical protein
MRRNDRQCLKLVQYGCQILAHRILGAGHLESLFNIARGRREQLRDRTLIVSVRRTAS